MPDPVSLTIGRLSHDGRGIALHQGRVVMVSGALPQEQVVAKIHQANSKLWQGSAIKLETTSPERAKPGCRYYGRCGGCQQQHMLHQTQLELKQQAIEDQIRRSGFVPQQWALPLVSKPWEYRHRARFHVDKAGNVGFFEAKKKVVVDIETCAVLQPELDQAFRILRLDAPFQGVIEFELAVDDFGKIGLNVGHGTRDALESLNDWARQNGIEVAEQLTYRAGVHRLKADVSDFTQVNRAINERMIAQAKDWLALTRQDKVLDLFCGNGNFSLALADDVSSVTGIEGSDKAVRNALAATHQITNAKFMVHNLFSDDVGRIPDLRESSTVILDPPRAGADAVCKVLANSKTCRKVLYVSCDPATLSRDLRYFSDSNWRLSKVGLIDMFPQTRHIETMVLLEQ